MIDDISLLAKAGLGTANRLQQASLLGSGRRFHMPGIGSGAPSV
jgi:hypothetical protein